MSHSKHQAAASSKKKVDRDQIADASSSAACVEGAAAAPSSPGRREFLGKVGGITAATIAANAFGVTTVTILTEPNAPAADIGPENGRARAEKAEEIRKDAAEAEERVRIPNHPDNGDEAHYHNKIGNYSKGLGHNPNTGEVKLADYSALIAAIRSGDFADFEALSTNGHLGCPDQTQQRRFVNPESGYAFDLEGTDSHQLAIRPAPAFASAEEAGEMVELYWMALLRDVNFRSYDSNPLALAAAVDLSNLSDFRGPKISGQVTPQTLFRDNYPGCTTGPYISQFLLQPVDFGAQRVDTRINTNAANVDYMTDFTSWLNVQNGCNTPGQTPTGSLVYCSNGRDLSTYVHIDALFQAYFVACLNLLGGTAAGGYPADAGNPYGVVVDGGAGRPRNAAIDSNGALAQVGFGTFGGPAILTMVCEPATRALKDVWYQKWLVHRRLRPEEFGGRVEVQRLGRATYPFHPDLRNSIVLPQVLSRFGSYLLAQAFPEGSPMHTSYGSGHATVAGACVTMLKALFDESAVIVNPVVPNSTGTALTPFVGPPLTVGGELNKIASNVSQGRNIAGVHWRTDAVESNKLGEAATISILKDMFKTYNEPFDGFSLTKFDGTTITIAGNPKGETYS